MIDLVIKKIAPILDNCSVYRNWDELLEIRELLQFPHGVCCSFIDVGSDMGFKLFRHKNPQFEHEKQTIAYGAGLAPKPGPIEVFNIKGYWFVGFWTEIVEIAEDIDYDEDILECEIDELRDKLYDAGLNPEDLHPGNVGYLDGDLVCIDFSHFDDDEEWHERHYHADNIAF